MASSQTSAKLSGRLKITQTVTGNVSTASDTAWVDMRDYGKFMAIVTATALTGVGITAFTILANTASDGTGDEIEVKAHGVASAPDAVGDWLMLECTAAEIAQLGTTNGYDYRYVTTKITAANASDTHLVTYIQGNPRFPTAGLTADTIA